MIQNRTFWPRVTERDSSPDSIIVEYKTERGVLPVGSKTGYPFNEPEGHWHGVNKSLNISVLGLSLRLNGRPCACFHVTLERKLFDTCRPV